MFKSIQLYGLIGAVILASLMALGWHVEKTSHKATKSEYEAFIAKTESIAALQKADNTRKEASLSERLNELSEAHQESLKAKDLDRQTLQRKLQDEIKLNSTLNRTLNRLQDTGSSSGGVSQVSINPEECATTERDSNRAIDTLNDAGKSCYYDYEFLYKSWEAVCEEYGCE